MVTQFLMRSLVLVFLTISSLTYAASSQAMGGHVGGGDATASDLQYIINNIDAYLLTDEGKEDFPEIKQPAFHELIITVRPVVKDERVQDQFGITQTCVSHAVEGNRYIQCDLQRLPKLSVGNQPTLYRIIFHELLFQAEIEKPISKEVPSDFKTSSRLKLHKNRNHEWALGEAKEYYVKGSSADNRTHLKYQVVWNPIGQDYRLAVTQLTFAKFLTPDSLVGLKIGHGRAKDDEQFDMALQSKHFVNNSFYFSPEVFFLNSKFGRDYHADYRLSGLGLGLRIGNQWQWKNFTFGCDWIGFGKTMVHFKNNIGEGLYTVTFLNAYLGWSF